MSTSRRTLLMGFLGAATLLPITGCTGTDDGSDGATTTTRADGTTVVEVGPNTRYEFSPGTDDPLRISAGTTVGFVWKSNTHNVHVTNQPEDADWPGHDDIEDAGFEYEFEFTVSGTYEYVCEPHESLGMTGTIVVDESEA